MTAKIGRPPAPNEVISITRSKTFGLSKGFCRKYGIGRWSYAVVYFDAYRERIALRFTDSRSHPGSFALSKAPTGGITIRANGFFGRYDIDVQRHARRYKVQRHNSRALDIDEDGDSFVIQLRGRRRRIGRHHEAAS